MARRIRKTTSFAIVHFGVAFTVSYLLTGSVGRLCRGALPSGAFWHYLSGHAAVATAGEEIAAAHADGRPQRDSL